MLQLRKQRDTLRRQSLGAGVSSFDRMAYTRPTKLNPPVDTGRDHVLGDPEAELTLVEYGNYTRRACHAAHEVIADLRDRFGERLRYVFRHRPAGESGVARGAAELAEYAFEI